MSKKILFVVKRRELVDDYGNFIDCPNDYGDYSDYCHGPYGETNSSGLFNSVRFAVAILQKAGVECKLVQVIDNNSIDKEVTAYNPDTVFIEALWVVPEKFEVLHKLHPNVKWVIRLHSEIPFLAMEGMAMDWLFKYVAQEKTNNVFVSANSQRVCRELAALLKTNITYTPNLYPLDTATDIKPDPTIVKSSDTIDISCFGAVRVLKNQLIQGIAAIEFAESIGKKLRFHINATRIEGKADPVLKNIRQLFAHTNHELVEHAWMNHHDFIALIKAMDIGMQVSFTETYNIVSADHIDNMIPVVTSNEVSFVQSIFQADPTNSADIVKKLNRAWTMSSINLHFVNKALLDYSNSIATKAWLNTFKQY